MKHGTEELEGVNITLFEADGHIDGTDRVAFGVAQLDITVHTIDGITHREFSCTDDIITSVSVERMQGYKGCQIVDRG